MINYTYVRELQNTLPRAAVWSLNDITDKQDIDDSIWSAAKRSSIADTLLDRRLTEDFDLEEVMSEVARHYLERALNKTGGGNKTKAAKLLNLKNQQNVMN